MKHILKLVAVVVLFTTYSCESRKDNCIKEAKKKGYDHTTACEMCEEAESDAAYSRK